MPTNTPRGLSKIELVLVVMTLAAIGGILVNVLASARKSAKKKNDT